MFNSPLHGIWQRHFKQLIPDDCRTRLTNLKLFTIGMYQAESIHLNKIAKKLPIEAKKLSLVRRLRRFLANEAVDSRRWYQSWATWLLQSAASGGHINLIVDATKVTSQYQLLCVAVGYHRRALPIAWDWVPHVKGRSSTRQQLDLLAYVHTLVPDDCSVSLVGDSEFGTPDVVEQLQDWDWNYALRQRKNTKLLLKDALEWQRVDEIDLQPGEAYHYRRVLFTESDELPTHFALIWKKGEKRPWYLATNQHTVQATRQLYSRRMWIEEMFGDMKGHGFDLEASRLRHAERLSRLMMVVSMIYLWFIALGEHVITTDRTHEVDRNDRTDLSIFRLGWDWLDRQCVLRRLLPDAIHPNLSLMIPALKREGASKEKMRPYF